MRDWKKVLAKPDLTENLNPFDKKGRVWVRNHAKRCPTCGDVFFAYALAEPSPQEMWEPYRVDPDPEPGMGKRDTCGDPKCLEIELRYQDRRDPRVQKCLEMLQAKAGTQPEAKVTKGFKKVGG